MTAPPIERTSAEDVVALATDTGPVTAQVGAILLLSTPDGLDRDAVVAALGRRLVAVPRLRQRLVRTPFGCGRPVWVDDDQFDLDHHLRFFDCPDPGDERSLLATAAAITAERLADDRPLWRLTVVTGLADGRTALVVVFHHVVADGIGGLAVLTNLVDGAPTPTVADFPRPTPSGSQLLLDAWRRRLASIPQLGVHLADVASELGRLRLARSAARSGRRSRTSPRRRALARPGTNRPTGVRREFAVARAPLDQLLHASRERGATVNDILLTAAAAALRTATTARATTVRSAPADDVTFSVMISTRSNSTARVLGNEIGVVPVRVVTAGDRIERLAAVSRATREAKQRSTAMPAAVLGAVARALAWLRLYRWLINHQQLIDAFSTNLRGPDTPLRFLGHAVTEVIPIGEIAGNVTVSFAALSYAGTLEVTIIVDPDSRPDVDQLREALQSELDAFISDSR